VAAAGPRGRKAGQAVEPAALRRRAARAADLPRPAPRRPAPPPPRQDGFARVLAFCGSAALRFAGAAVARVTDVAAALVPDTVPRARVELAVKACLMLLSLAVLKSVLSVRAARGVEC
jgi:hypothetical protein